MVFLLREDSDNQNHCWHMTMSLVFSRAETTPHWQKRWWILAFDSKSLLSYALQHAKNEAQDA